MTTASPPKISGEPEREETRTRAERRVELHPERPAHDEGREHETDDGRHLMGALHGSSTTRSPSTVTDRPDRDASVSYRSVYFGCRFSRKARIPSLASFVIVRSALFACESL